MAEAANLTAIAVNIEQIKGDIRVIRSEQGNMKQDVEHKHTENRSDIAAIKKDIKAIQLQDAKNAGYFAGAVAVGAVFVHFLDKLWK